MNAWIESINFSIAGAALLLSVLGLWITAVVPGIDRWSKRFFISYFLIFMLCCLSSIVEAAAQYYIVTGPAFYFLLFLETLLFILPLPMLTVYLLHCCGENMRKSMLLRIVLGLWAIMFIIFISAAFIEGFFYVTPEDQYYRGPLYPLFLLPVLAIMLLNLAGTLKRRKRLSRKVFLAFLITILPITVAVIVSLFVDIFPFIDISYVLTTLAMYSFILSDQIEQDRRQQQEIADQQREIANQQREIANQQREIANQQREIANQRASVMVLQMRPHLTTGIRRKPGRSRWILLTTCVRISMP